MLSIPLCAARILQALEQNGFEAYVVGGCVRDALLGKTPHDWDICTAALPEQVKACFPGISIIETGIQHGTVTLVENGEPYEITTFRADGAYSDGRRPDSVAFVRSIGEDLSRRDFTVNAMAYHPQKGLIDLYGGQADLSAGVLRCVGNAETRFREDALRILRALRFASVFGFRLEAETARAAAACRALLSVVSAERIAHELEGILCGRDVEAVLLQYREVLAEPIPELARTFGFAQKNPYHRVDVWTHTVRAVSAVPSETCLRLAALLHDLGKPDSFSLDDAGTGHFFGHEERGAAIAGEILRRLRFDFKTVKTVELLVRYHDSDLAATQACARRWLGRLGEETLRGLLALKKADIRAQSGYRAEERLTLLQEFTVCMETVLREGQCISRADLAVNGRDLIASGVPEGPDVGAALDRLLELVISGEAENRKEVLLERLK